MTARNIEARIVKLETSRRTGDDILVSSGQLTRSPQGFPSWSIRSRPAAAHAGRLAAAAL